MKLAKRYKVIIGVHWPEIHCSENGARSRSGCEVARVNPHILAVETPSAVLPRLIQCDGACKTWAPEDYIIQFGLCDHNICFRCYENEESIALTNDGTRGCCNKECVQRAKAELAIKTPTPKSSTSAIALGSSTRYRAFPGTRKKANLERYVDQQPAPRTERTRKSKAWKSKLQAVNSDVSFFGDYDDARLQEMAETMRSGQIC